MFLIYDQLALFAITFGTSMPHHLFSFSSSNSSACVDARARRHSSLVLASDTRGSNISGARQGTCSCGRVVTGSQAVAG